MVLPLNFILTFLDDLAFKVTISFSCNEQIVDPLILLINWALNSLVAFVAGTSISFALIDIVIEHSSSVAPHSKYETKYTPVSLILIELLSGYSVKKATPFSGRELLYPHLGLNLLAYQSLNI